MKIATPLPAPDLAGLSFEATDAIGDVAGAMRDGLLAFSAAPGLVVMRQMLDAELASIVGAKHAKLARDLTGLDVTVLMIDGLNVADQMIVVAMVICADGTKIPIGLKLATPRTPSWSKTSSPTSSPAGGGQPFVAPKVRYPG